jgi:hypothetical protein
MGCSKPFGGVRAFVVGALVGGIAWIGWYPVLALAIAMPALWLAMPTRRAAWLLVMGYYLVGSHTVAWGAATYFDRGIFWGSALWFAGACLQSLAWVLPWHKTPHVRSFTLFIAYALSTLPPIGVYGVDHPLTAAGLLFPGAGWAGLAFAAVLPLAWQHRGTRIGRYALAAAFAVAGACQLAPTVPPPDGWTALQTQRKEDAIARRDIGYGYEAQMELIESVRAQGGVVVLPESIVVDWTEANAELWRGRVGEASVLLGTTITPPNAKYDNVIVGVNGRESRVVYAQRLPIPVSMYRPWDKRTGANAHWFETPVFEWEGKRVGALICYEQTQLWPVLHTMLHKPDILIAPANLWWCSQTTGPYLMRNYIHAWGRLFRVPTLVAFNE